MDYMHERVLEYSLEPCTLFATQMRPELISVLHCLSRHGYSISSLLEEVLASQAYDLRDPLI